jgi:uncharacterized protein (TIGR00375 family)
MPFYADLHIHSRFSRATSRDLDLGALAWWAQRKGIAVLGTGDFTHPAWIEELRASLVPAEPGLFRLRPELERAVEATLPPSCRRPVRFMLSVEISTIYKRAERTRKVHHLVYAPDFEAAAELNRRLGRIGNLAADGRPILGLDSRDLLEITLHSGTGSYLVPAHVWTPWFAALGSKSGFDAIEDCYADLAGHIFALETGLSSDPAMNWRVSALDRYRLVSNSDAHSAPALGREASVFDTELDYYALRRALETGEGYLGTVEFFPEEGKYHLDGHRKCGVRLEPAETRRLGARCPACGRPLTVGVLSRVEELADRPEGARPPGAAGFRSLVPLPEVLGELLGTGARSKGVMRQWEALTERLGPELPLLETLPVDELRAACPTVPLLPEAIARLRRGEVVREAGYDGEYGVIRVFRPEELRARSGVAALFEPGAATTSRRRERAARKPSGANGTPQLPAARPVDNASRRPSELGRLASGGPPGDEAAQAGVTGIAGFRAGSAAAGAEAPDGPGFGQPAADGTRVEPVPPLLSALDPEQRAAASVTAGPLLIIAGPGTGKTRTLTHRIAHLISSGSVAPEQWLALTFTRRAAEELRERLRALIPAQAGRVLATTFHGLGLQLLREQHQAAGRSERFRIVDEAERLALLRAALGPGASDRDARRLLPRLARHKRGDGAEPAGTAGAGRHARSEHEEAFARYDDALRELDLVDLDDLIALPVRLLEADPALAEQYRRRWPYVAVDEYQDVDALQYRLLRLLVPADGNLCAIGDPDQAIYGFRGADVGFFLRFQQDFPRAAVVRLRRNYRSSAAIVAGALQAIAPATLVRGRVLEAVRQDPAAGPPRISIHRAASERAEAEFVARSIDQLLGGSSFFSLDSGRVEHGGEAGLSFADIAVLYRTDAQAAPLVEALSRAGVPFQKRSHDRLADRPGVAPLLAALRGGAGTRAWGGFGEAPVLIRLRQAAELVTGQAGGTGGTGDAGAATLEGEVRAALELLTPLAERCGSDLERFLAELALGAEVDTWDPRADRVSLLTLHAAKGLEFAVVFLTGCEDGLLPLRFQGQDRPPGGRGDDAEERRLFFVGMTRAKSHLLLTHARQRTRHGTVVAAAPSPYLADIEEALLEHYRAAVRRPRPATPAADQLQLL